MRDAVRIDDWYDAAFAEGIRFVNRGGVFIFITNQKQSCAGIWRSETVIAKPERLLRGISERFSQMQELEFKLAGQGDSLAKIAEILETMGMRRRTLTATAAVAEIRFYAREARAQIASAAMISSMQSTAPSQAKAPTVKQDLPQRPQPLAEKLPRRIRIGIIDDAKQIRYLLRKIFADSPDFEVAWEAERPSIALQFLAKDRPDAITLDLHMPEMNGAQLLKKYITQYPVPTVIVSSLSENESPLVFEALEAGAVDYIQKPVTQEFSAIRDLMLERLRVAAAAKVLRSRPQFTRTANLVLSPQLIQGRIIAIGASTGGTEALRELLTQLPKEIPPIVIVQHIPPVFSRAFAERLNQLCPFEVKEAENGDAIRPGRVLIAPGGKHMEVAKVVGGCQVLIQDTAAVNRHKPSVDVLFESVCRVFGHRSVGVLLTGMGADGAKGLKALRDAGARTVAQSEASCVVFGMPKEAIKLEAAEEIAPLENIADILIKMFLEREAKASPLRIKVG